MEREGRVFRAKESLMVCSFLNLNQTASISVYQGMEEAYHILGDLVFQ